ncbi:unnamed protein product [Didymodactylos carnosus]|uniref:Uncharacterized protein n=1 Tax=Didymodactylos carnosus TaxID=1234261 RepID=A0A8S2H3E9_9BILA|nr:unnamed protein product [Didymodactylos carnosus]CAF3596957.1 unnamed protein product [Didymodactylos carnosus]
MIIQRNEYTSGGEIAIWLLITVGALLVPIIVIAICCIRRHSYNGPYGGSQEKIDSLAATPKQNGSSNISNDNNLDSLSKTGSLKKQHVHWPDGCSITTTTQDSSDGSSNINNNNNNDNDTVKKASDFITSDLRTIKDKQFSPRKQPPRLNTEHLYENGGAGLNITNIESPLTRPKLPATSSALSYLIQSAVVPAGSTVSGRTLIDSSTKSTRSEGIHLPGTCLHQCSIRQLTINLMDFDDLLVLCKSLLLVEKLSVQVNRLSSLTLTKKKVTIATQNKTISLPFLIDLKLEITYVESDTYEKIEQFFEHCTKLKYLTLILKALSNRFIIDGNVVKKDFLLKMNQLENFQFFINFDIAELLFGGRKQAIISTFDTKYWQEKHSNLIVSYYQDEGCCSLFTLPFLLDKIDMAVDDLFETSTINKNEIIVTSDL